MKLKHFILCSLLCVTMCGCQFNNNNTENADPRIFTDSVHWYTSEQFDIPKYKTTEKTIEYLSDYNGETKPEYITSSFTNRRYVKLDLPSKYNYDNQYGTKLFSEDGSIVIELVKGDYDLGDNEVQYLSNEMKYTKTDVAKISHIAVKDLNDYYIVAHVYSNSEDWTTVVNALNDCKYETVIGDLNYERENLEEDSFYKNNIQTFFAGDEYTSTISGFADGWIYYCNYPNSVFEVKDMALAYMKTKNVSLGEDVKIFNYSNDCDFIYCGNYFVCYYRNNEQFTTTIFGKGKEAINNAKYCVMQGDKDEG